MQALGRGAWEEARSALEQALRADDSPEVLFGLGEALWWLGEILESARCCERAYVAFRRLPDPVGAANVALQLTFLYQDNLGNHAAAAGWAAHAARLIDEFDLEPMRGWVFLTRACGSQDPGQSETLARDARRLAAEVGDRDLELCALSEIGYALVEQGRVAEGVPLIDEAMAGALAGEGRLDTVVFTSCQMIHACNRCADFERVVQWVRAADRFIERYGCPYLNATCRAHYGGVLFATGNWHDAEKELIAALELSEDALPVVRGEALTRLAELRLAQGRLEEAERLLAGFEDHEAAAPVQRRILLLRGNLSLAAATARRRLGVVGENRLESALLLELLGEVEIGQGQVEVAAERGRKLAELGGTLDCRVMLARGERLRGHALSDGGDAEAKGHLEAALSEFARLGMPFETARTRLLIAQALRELDPEVAERRPAPRSPFSRTLARTPTPPPHCCVKQRPAKHPTWPACHKGVGSPPSGGAWDEQPGHRRPARPQQAHRPSSRLEHTHEVGTPLPDRRRDVRRPARLDLTLRHQLHLFP